MLAVVLAGGENKRLPVTKGLIDIGGRRLIETILDRLAAYFDRLAISTNEPEKYFYLGVPLVGDVYPVRGPMTGIFSVLSWMEDADGQAFFVACDMPSINVELAARLYETRTSGWDVLAPLWQGRPEPLFSFYSSRCLPLLEKSILAGLNGEKELSLRKFLETASTRFLEEDAVKEIDPQGRSFININTEDDLKSAMETAFNNKHKKKPVRTQQEVF
ncbi:MAG: molybdenum cofactor guanylyltransferase [Nitrospiraceae bacterium]|nr:molybdenum cofactor guanylyltransferase [Nitrospiraceae bacterium]